MDRKVPEGWKEEGNSLKREFEFANFKQVLAFMSKVGEDWSGHCGFGGKNTGGISEFWFRAPRST